MATTSKPSVISNFEKPFLWLTRKLMETLTWSLLPCLLLPHQRLARTRLWQRNMSMI
uniref:Uncharacterized protein n=1 Tax=Urocitellus parryii TaxID=9999 RepID=A0A8D2HN03_UROPR